MDGTSGHAGVDKGNEPDARQRTERVHREQSTRTGVPVVQSPRALARRGHVGLERGVQGVVPSSSDPFVALVRLKGLWCEV